MSVSAASICNDCLALRTTFWRWHTRNIQCAAHKQTRARRTTFPPCELPMIRSTCNGRVFRRQHVTTVELPHTRLQGLGGLAAPRAHGPRRLPSSSPSSVWPERIGPCSWFRSEESCGLSSRPSHQCLLVKIDVGFAIFELHLLGAQATATSTEGASYR